MPGFNPFLLGDFHIHRRWSSPSRPSRGHQSLEVR